MANPDNLPSQLNYFYHSSFDDDGTCWATPISQTGTANMITTPLAVNIETPFTLQGAYFTGLDPSSKLVVDAVYVVERFADDLNSDLATLSRPSSTYDAEALKLYSKIAREMPPGVEVGANGFGDWIAGIAGVVSKVAKAASFIPGPIGAIAGGIGAISDVVIEEIGVDNRPAIPIHINPNPMNFKSMQSGPTITQGNAPIVEVVRPTQQQSFQVVNPKQKKPKRINRKGPMLVQGNNQMPVPYEIIYPKQNFRQKRIPVRRNTVRQMISPRTNNSVQYSTWAPPNFRRRY